MKLIDLTHTLTENVPQFSNCGFHMQTTTDYQDCQGAVKFCVQKLDFHLGTGTHLDAPAHIKEGGICIHEIPIEHLLSPLIVIDISNQAHETYLVSKEDIFAFEKIHGAIPESSFIVFNTGWAKLWPTEKFRNNLKFPTVSLAAAELLMQRSIVGIGIDTLSPDTPESGYPVHALLLGQGKLILECVANIDKMPATGSQILLAPMKIKGATESPTRVFGLAHFC